MKDRVLSAVKELRGEMVEATGPDLPYSAVSP